MFKVILFLPVFLFGITQDECLDLVDDEARKWTNYPTRIKAMAMTETSCAQQLIGDLNKNVLKASLGVMQFKIDTARETIERDAPDLSYMLEYSDRKFATILLTDHRLSVRLAALRFERYIKIYGVKVAVQAHNGLYGGFAYWRRTSKWNNWLINKTLNKH